MKKKVLVIAAVVLIFALVGGTTLAWFSDEDGAKNVFTVGSVEILQHEMEHDENGDLVPFTQNKMLLPIVNLQNPALDENYQEKIVSVENVGENSAYIRTFLAIPAALEEILVLDLADSSGWVRDTALWANQTVDGVAYKVISFTYASALIKNASTQVLLEGVYLDPAVDIDVDPSDNTRRFCTEDANGVKTFYDYDLSTAADDVVTVLVATQAVQSEGFSSPEGAFTASFPSAPDLTAIS